MRLNVRTGADLGRAIGELRRDSNLTQAGLSELVGLDPKYISKIESGRTVSLLEHELRILRRLGATITIELPDSPIRLAGWKGRPGGARSEAQRGPASINESKPSDASTST
jgi:transcriptional regulator with XRE-family HTH domain